MTRLKFLILLFSFLVMIGCAANKLNETYFTRIYVGSYDKVWSSAQKALSEYPLKISNKDLGKIHSEIVNGPYNELFVTYPEPLQAPDRYRYSLKLSFAKLEEASPEEGVIRVRIIKELERFKDFYAGWLPSTTDGLEEKLILYRIEHLLRMEQALSAMR